jgi:uncharacterized protein YkwD
MVWDNRLEKAARRHYEDCIKHKSIDHEGSDKSNPWTRLKDAGFPCPTWDLKYGSEGIALGFGPNEPPLDSFAQETNYKYVPNQRSHAADLLNPHYNRIGAAGPTAGGWPLWVVTYGHDKQTFDFL